MQIANQLRLQSLVIALLSMALLAGITILVVACMELASRCST
jgi:hypothetical protein